LPETAATREVEDERADEDAEDDELEEDVPETRAREDGVVVTVEGAVGIGVEERTEREQIGVSRAHAPVEDGEVQDELR